MADIEVETVEIRILKFFLTFKAVTTENGKKKPKLIKWYYEGFVPGISLRDIPRASLNAAYRKAAVIFNRF